jgi:hypothetical protein
MLYVNNGQIVTFVALSLGAVGGEGSCRCKRPIYWTRCFNFPEPNGNLKISIEYLGKMGIGRGLVAL